MLKKAGFVTSAVAGLMMVGGVAFADGNGGGAEQVGLVNVDDTEVLEHVNVPLCLTNNHVAAGPVAVAANILNPTMFDRCAEGTIWTGDEISD